MATVSRRMLRLIAVAGTVPAVGIAVGYRTRRMQAAENNSPNTNRVFKTSDIPIYPNSDSDIELPVKTQYPRNALEGQIGDARKSVQGVLGQFQGIFDTISATANTGIEHSKAGLEYVQNEPGELPRVAAIVVAGLGGVVLGYRGGVLKKVTYGSIAALSIASLCYPKRTVELAGTATGYVKDAWRDIGGEEAWNKYSPFPKEEKAKSDKKPLFEGKAIPHLQSEGKPSEAKVETAQNVTPMDESMKAAIVKEAIKVATFKDADSPSKIVGDLGQSNPSDKDMYSTRSS